jgi:L-ascorbate metabolism protein UlaG (beta-lactamase superfamily)
MGAARSSRSVSAEWLPPSEPAGCEALGVSPSRSDDLDALRGLEASGPELPAELSMQWLGVSGYRLTYEGVSLFIDPYLSRVPLRSLLLRRPAVPDAGLIERYAGDAGEVAGVLVGHTHFDHAVAAPAIAARYSAKAYGSASLVQLMRLHGLGPLAIEVVPHRTYELGPFSVRFIPSRHSKLLFGRRVPMDGELTCDHFGGLVPTAYKCGQV